MKTPSTPTPQHYDQPFIRIVQCASIQWLHIGYTQLWGLDNWLQIVIAIHFSAGTKNTCTRFHSIYIYLVSQMQTLPYCWPQPKLDKTHIGNHTPPTGGSATAQGRTQELPLNRNWGLRNLFTKQPALHNKYQDVDISICVNSVCQDINILSTHSFSRHIDTENKCRLQ